MIEWLKNVFRESSDTSSKRLTGVSLIYFGIFVGSLYITYTLLKNIASDPNVFSFLEFAIGAGVTVLTGGTLSERVLSKYTDRNKKDKDDK